MRVTIPGSTPVAGERRVTRDDDAVEPGAEMRLVSASAPRLRGSHDYMESFVAWDAVLGRTGRENIGQCLVRSQTVVTAGDAVFYGTYDRWVNAVNRVSNPRTAVCREAHPRTARGGASE